VYIPWFDEKWISAYAVYAPSVNKAFSCNSSQGFIFSYYNKNVSATFTEVDGVYGRKINLKDKDDFEKFVSKQTNNLKKGFKSSETLQQITENTLLSNADYIHSVYFVTTDTKPDIKIAGQYPTLQLRQYSVMLYKKDLKNGKRDLLYSVYFSERGLQEELHTREEIKWKIQQLINSCEFISTD
jgi:hypothetical protein